MNVIKLKEWYPDSAQDCLIEVNDELVQQFKAWQRTEQAYERKKLRYRAYYSLDCSDGIEHQVVPPPQAPDEQYMRNAICEQLNIALASITTKQAMRIYAHYVLGISQSEIARREGVSSKAVNLSIQSGLKQMARFLKEID